MRRVLVLGLLVGVIATSAWTACALVREHASLSSRWGATTWWVDFILVLAAIGSGAVALARRARAEAPRIATFAPLRGAFVCFTAASLVTLLWLQPYEPVDALVCYAIAGGAYSLGLLVAPRIERALGPRRSRVLDFLAFQLALAPFVAELALRVWNRADPTPLWDTTTRQGRAWIERRREEPGSVRRGFRINSDGFFDREPSRDPPPAHLVACIGDSFSLGTVPQHRHYTTLCERELEGRGLADLEVYNAGVPGADPPTYEVMLDDLVLPLRPELVVIALFVGNDVDGSIPAPPARFAHPWLDRHALLCFEVPRRLLVLASERRAGATIGERTTPPRILSIDELESRMPWLDDALIEPPTLSTERFLWIETDRAQELATDGVLDYSHLFARLAAMRERTSPLPLAVLVLPDQFQVDDDLWARLERTIATPGLDRDLPQRRITAWLETEGIAFVDLLPRLRALPPLADGRIHAYHEQDTHFNARGNEVAAIGLADLIERCLPPPK